MKVFVLCIVGTILLTFGVARSVHKSSSTAQDRPLPAIVNKTESFQVESLTGEISRPDTREMLYVLKLKNVSEKTITAYVIKYPSLEQANK